MGRKSETSALSALSALERGEVLSSLLRAHPSLVAEAERGTAVGVRDAGYTEVAPGSLTVIAVDA